MNKYFNKILASVAIMLGIFGAFSCTDYLDKAPNSDIDPEDVFKNFRNFQGFTEELYNAIPLLTAHEYHTSINWGEEIIWETTATYPLAYRIDLGDYWAWDGQTSWLKTYNGNITSTDRFDKGSFWPAAWYSIRKANIGLANLDKLTEATPEEKDLIAGQLYFFRGWNHFMLMQFWGGLPYIDEELPSDQVLQIPRLNYHETAEKVALDLQKAADLLPVDWDNTTIGKATLGNNNFRANKVMALSFLGKNLLFAASPLMNNESTGNSNYNVELCKRAAKALGEALQICESTGRYELAPFDRYTELFYTHNQNGRLPGVKETIMYENVIDVNGRWRWNMINDFRPQTIISSGVKVFPTSNYVNYYGMQNGLPINDITAKDAESGYDPEYPWKDRDPRFYHSIMFDGNQCLVNPYQVNFNGGRVDVQHASLYTGGFYREGDAAKSVVSGYMLTKFSPRLANTIDGDNFRNNVAVVLSLIRLADVYLLYSEAVANGHGINEKAGGFGLSAVEALNKIRNRAGIGDVNDKYLANASRFMEEVRRERAVELAFEGHRFTDLRRWMLLLQKPYTLKTAVEFDRANDISEADLYKNPENGRVLNIRERVLLERQLGLRHYWFPFRRADVSMYEGFSQNPGW